MNYRTVDSLWEAINDYFSYDIIKSFLTIVSYLEVRWKKGLKFIMKYLDLLKFKEEYP